MFKIEIFFLTVSVPMLLCAASKAYGPFSVRITSFSACHLPKPKDCATMSYRMSGPALIAINYNVTKTCTPTKGKIVMLFNGKETRLQIGNPCKHLFVKPIFDSLFNVTKKCEIVKGIYRSEVDMGGYITSYFGGNFFYGNVTFKTFFYSDECNFTCTCIKVEMTPKK